MFVYAAYQSWTVPSASRLNGRYAVWYGYLPASSASTTYTHGYDVSWPQCSSAGNGHQAAHMPTGGTYVILGLTHGAGHTVNPCLGAQLKWAKEHGVMVGAYMVPSYPTPAQLAVLLRTLACSTDQMRLYHPATGKVSPDRHAAVLRHPGHGCWRSSGRLAAGVPGPPGVTDWRACPPR